MRPSRSPLTLILALGLGLFSLHAHAVPAFARQTGMDCTTCHMSWLELTNVGRRFKLGGYQQMKNYPDDAKRPLVSLDFDGAPPLIPVAFAVQLSDTITAKPNTPYVTKGGNSSDLPLEREPILNQASIFFNGRIVDHVGCFCQFTYDGVAQQTSIDNFEIRVADTYKGDSLDAIYGISLNNNPTMSDVWNTTPVWGWPYFGANNAIGPVATPIINGSLGQSVAGVTAYALLYKTLYLEVGGYRTSEGPLAFLHLNNPLSARYQLDGTAPYYRVALQHDWDHGHHSMEVGAFGLQPAVYSPGEIAAGPADKYRDQGYDAQYQYITDRHRFSWMTTYIKETQRLDHTYAMGGSANLRNDVSFFSTKLSYYFKKWYGINIGYQRTAGSADVGLYSPNGDGSALPTVVDPGVLANSASGRPDTEAVITEVDWLFDIHGAEVFRRTRALLQYTAYTKFSGGTSNYNGFGRSASDNNQLVLGLWLMY
jgi:hypothetical protein